MVRNSCPGVTLPCHAVSSSCICHDRCRCAPPPPPPPPPPLSLPALPAVVGTGANPAGEASTNPSSLEGCATAYLPARYPPRLWPSNVKGASSPASCRHASNKLFTKNAAAASPAVASPPPAAVAAATAAVSAASKCSLQNLLLHSEKPPDVDHHLFRGRHN